MEAERPLGRVAILGLGLMGGSVARGIASLQLAHRIVGWSPESTERDAALTAGAVTLAAGQWREAVVDADLVVLAAPLEATRRLLAEVADATPATTTLTDVASLKAPLAETAEAAGVAARWVGSHPMAGAESSGFWASRADLFEGARVWTVERGAEDAHVRAVERLWTGLGAAPRAIEAEEHDRLMAWVSHLPQLLANALADVLEHAGVDADRLGPGGRDMTRLAGSDPRIWSDLLAQASPTLVGGLRGVAQRAERLADLVESGDVDGVDRLMRRTRAWRAGS
jgi:cyclohexadieny/prephenate dehydrogenase / 3-phosphoshikimate 1-carboxyvinyltransferase